MKMYTFNVKGFGDMRTLECQNGGIWFLNKDIRRIIRETGISLNSFVYQIAKIENKHVKTFTNVELEILFDTSIEVGKRLKFINFEALAYLTVSTSEDVDMKFEQLKRGLYNKIVLQILENDDEINYLVDLGSFLSKNDYKNHKNVSYETKKRRFSTRTMETLLGVNSVRLHSFLFNNGLVTMVKGEWIASDRALKYKLATIEGQKIYWTEKGNAFITQHLNRGN